MPVSVSTRSHAARLFRVRVAEVVFSSEMAAMATTAVMVAMPDCMEMAATVAKALPVPRGSMELMLPNQAAPGPTVATVATEAMAVMAATVVRADRFLVTGALVVSVALAASVATAVTALPVPRE